MKPQLSKGYLIDLVYDEPTLWNYRIKEYTDRDGQIQLWDKIGEQLKTSGRTAERSWEDLVDTYKKLLRRSLEKGVKPNWQYFSSMHFMQDVIVCRGLRKPKDISTSCMREEADHAQTTRKEVTVSCWADNQVTNSEQVQHYKLDQLDLEENKLQIALKVEKNEVLQQKEEEEHSLTRKRKCEDDEDYMFLMSLLPSIQQLDRIQKMHLRIEMLTSVTRELQTQLIPTKPNPL